MSVKQDNLGNWFKFYYEWCKTISSMPDKERLIIMDLIVNTAICCAEDKEPNTPDGIPQILKGWVEILLVKMREDYAEIEEGRRRKAEAVNRRWAKAKGVPEPSEPQESTPTPSEAQNLNQWQREFYRLIQRPEDEIICFCRANKLTCINAYIAWCATFIEAMKGEGRTHKDETDLIDHFNKWFYKLGSPKPSDKIERMTYWLGYYRRLFPEKSHLIPNVQEGGNMRVYADYNREVARQARQAEAEGLVHKFMERCKESTPTPSEDDTPF